MHLFYEKKKHGCVKASLKLCICKISCKCKKALKKKNYSVKLVIIIISGRNQECFQPLTCNYFTHFIS